MCLWVAKFKLNSSEEIPEDKLNILEYAISLNGSDSLGNIMNRYTLPIGNIANGFRHADCNFLGLLSIVFVKNTYWNSTLNCFCFGKIKAYKISSCFFEVLYQGDSKCSDYISTISSYCEYFITGAETIEMYNEDNPVEADQVDISERVMSPSEDSLRRVLSSTDTEDDLDTALFSVPVRYLGSEAYG